MKPLKDLVADPDVAAKLPKLVECLAQGYRDAGDNYRPEIGSDARTTGMDIYTFVWFQIRESKLLDVTPKEPYWMELDGEHVACHRVAKSSGTSIDTHFPRDRNGWPTTVIVQAKLSFEPEDKTPEKILVLAHVGNPQEGLLAAYICRPLIDELGFLVSWIDTELIWKKGVEPSSTVKDSEVSQEGSEKSPEENKPPAAAKPKKKPGDEKKREGDGSQ